MIYDFQQCGILTSVDSDEPVQPSYKLRNSKCDVRSVANSQRIFKRLAKALIRLRVCAGCCSDMHIVGNIMSRLI